MVMSVLAAGLRRKPLGLPYKIAMQRWSTPGYGLG